VPRWIKILFALLPKKAIAELVLSGLKKLAEKTETTIDDEILRNIERWLRENKILDEIQMKKLKSISTTDQTLDKQK
jgi:hypothetical protein